MASPALEAMRKIALGTATVVAALTVAGPATASASQPCGAVYTTLYGSPQVEEVWVNKRGPVTCGRARAITVSIYGERGKRTWHCLRGHPNCAHAHSYWTQRGLPGWKFWTGPGGGAARRGQRRVDFYYYT